MADLTLFNITVPLIRKNADNMTDIHEVTARIPSTNEETARDVARELGWAIVSNLPDVGDNNRHGWKIANYGVSVEEVK